MAAEHYSQFASNPKYKEACRLASKCKTLEDIEDAVRSIDTGDMTASTVSVSPLTGCIKPPIMILGKSPGATEIVMREPFAGPAGDILHRAFEMADEEITGYHRTYATRWRPRKNNTPTNTQLAISHPFLVREIQIVRPRKIIVLGAKCSDTLLGDHPHMDEETEHLTQWNGIPVVIIRNNGFILRSPQLLPEYAATIARHGYNAENNRKAA